MLDTVLLVLTLVSQTPSPKVSTDGPPSCEASKMPGAAGTFELKPPGWRGSPRHPHPPGPTTYWLDTDGVDPGTPGCHVETTDQRRLKRRTFGEYCQPDGLLVESNPGRDKLHVHENDLGHPDRFNCDAWCKGTGHAGGSCVEATATPCGKSARCECS